MSPETIAACARLIEIERVQELLPLYDEIQTGIFAATMMRQSR